MSLVDEYKNQLRWRSWSAILDALPSLEGKTVIDLGCGVGDLSAELVARGATVIGVDMNEDLLAHARSRGLAGAEFRGGDLRAPLDLGTLADGVWSSFTAAYFPDLRAALSVWTSNLKPGGWIALTEIDDMFGHEPLSERTKAVFKRYADDALAAGRYDFLMGHKLERHLESSGFTVSKAWTVADQELSFDGPAGPDVVAVWRARLDRMGLLRSMCGPEFEEVRDELLECLGRADHKSTAKVYCCIAEKPLTG